MRYVALFVCSIVLTCAAWAQTSQISGTIRDASGLAIPGASIKVTQTATGVARNTLSSGEGTYVLPNLPIGPYLLEVAKEGFTKYVQKGIVLQVDTNPTIDVGLQVGAVSEQVTVEANAAQVETRTTSIGQVVTNQQIAEMPLNGRNPIELVFLAGMANFPGNGNINTVRNYPTVVVSVAGGQGNGVGYLLDGAMHQDPYNNLALPLPFPDALQEFKVETSAVPAQFGYHATAVVNAVTKSGTNEFHGDAFEFLRNGDFNARDFFATKRDTLKRNQFGGVIGGPIKRDKLFFFAGYQRTSQRSDPSQNTAVIPTSAMAAGDFTAVAAPACNSGRAVTLPSTLGFTNNQISPTLLNPVALNILKTLPTPINECGRVPFGLVANQDEDLGAFKLDYQASPKNSMFARFTSAHLNVASTFDGKNPLSINTVGVEDLDYSLALGDTYLLGPNLVNSLHLSASRTNIPKVPDNYGSWKTFGANVTPISGNSLAIVAGSNFVIGGGAASPGESHNGPNPSLSDDVSWVKGRHQFGFGGNVYRQQMNYWSGVNGLGTATFDGGLTGLILGDFMLGRPVSFVQGTLYGFYERQYYFSLYAQDSWKVTPRLTVNYGLRWEPYTSYYNKTGQIVHFDPTLFAQNVHSTMFKNAPAGLVFPGDPQYPCGNSYNCNTWAKFFPRLGLAWDPRGDGRMTIRAAFGMYGDRSHMFWPNQNTFSPPFGNNIAVAGANLSDPWANYPGGNPMPLLQQLNTIGHASPNAPFFPFGNYVNLRAEDYRPTYINQWNLSIQKQMGQDWLITLNYLGNSTIHMITSQGGNPAVFLGTGPCTLPNGVSYAACSTTANQNFRRVFYLQNPSQGGYFAGIGQQDSGGTASYQGFYASVQKRLSHGVTVLANYTYSHCISDIYDQQTTANGVAGNIPGNRRAYRSNCLGSDLRQLFVLNMVATSPKFSGRVARILASDWQIAPIMEIKSAQFYTVISGMDRALTVAPNQTPNLVNLNPYAAQQTVTQWMNPLAFSLPAPGTYGNLGYNNMKGPGVFQLNVALSRTFPIRERKTIQVRAEAFNLPNTLNPSTPNTDPRSNTTGFSATNTPNFGQITNDISGNNGLNSGDYRIIQLAMKFVF
ncbi:MAG: hypothetical protein C5B51_15370 [Terriglobia bacterium]|nr:MAG: hypothetical protein C5B51_15370 [Terriglobia bacterium]